VISPRTRRTSRLIDLLFTSFLISFFLLGHTSFAQDHVVSPLEIQRDLAASAAARQANVAQLDAFFSSDQARKALKSANIDYEQVHNAIRMLSDQDLANVSARAQKAQKDFAAGSVTNIELLFIVLAAVIIILVIVIH
jgi:hypothetical protein